MSHFSDFKGQDRRAISENCKFSQCLKMRRMNNSGKSHHSDFQKRNRTISTCGIILCTDNPKESTKIFTINKRCLQSLSIQDQCAKFNEDCDKKVLKIPKRGRHPSQQKRVPMTLMILLTMPSKQLNGNTAVLISNLHGLQSRRTRV